MSNIDENGYIISNNNMNEDLINKIDLYNKLSNNNCLEKEFKNYLDIIEEVNNIELEIFDNNKYSDDLQSE